MTIAMVESAIGGKTAQGSRRLLGVDACVSDTSLFQRGRGTTILESEGKLSLLISGADLLPIALQGHSPSGVLQSYELV